ncbi:hypothetical protein Dimus_004015 [Dionaea muscipula]
MSARDQAAAAILRHLAFAADGAVLGVALAYVAVRTFIKLASTSSAIRKIRAAPSVSVSDLRSLLSSSSGGDNSIESGGGEGGAKLVVVRGTVEAKSAVYGSWKSLGSDALVSNESSTKAVVIQRTQSCIYNQWRGLFSWNSDLRGVLRRTWKEQESSSTRMVPFILIDADGQQPHRNYVVVNLDGSIHDMPLITVYHHLQPISASAYSVLQAIFGLDYPIGLLDEEKILPLGKNITAIGICYPKNGVPEIKSCEDLPFFLSELTKDQMVVELTDRAKILIWTGVIFGSMAVGVLGYAILRNWNKWKAWRERRRAQQRPPAVNDDEYVLADDDPLADDDSLADVDEDVGDIPDGQLCVVCLTRRRRSAFVPCGHRVCCQVCALSIERNRTPKCPVCRLVINGSIRIFDS